MLIGSECGLNLLLGFDNSLQKVVTQTILTQEEIFKNQVLELHRLYEIQTVLMNELDLNVRDGERSNLCFGPSSKNSKYEPFATEMTSSEVHTICSSRPMRMSFDLELPASHYISDNEVSAITKHDLEPSFSGVDMSYKNMSARRKLFCSHKEGELLDLNKALPDESSSGVSNNEETFFTVLDWRNPNNSTLMASASKDSDEIICQSTFCGPQLDAKGHVPLSEMNIEGTDSNRSPVSCKSDSIAETKSQPSDRKKEKIDGVDRTVRAGAVSLVYFSLECSSKKNQDHSIEPKKRKECCNSNNNNEKDGYESSSESYESIVLREPECGACDYGMTSALTEATILSDKKEHGMKLRRGRRMKDFRKEILPNMASLSREEIREDIKIMQLAVRSREYKKYKSKPVRGSRCVSSVVKKSKRSKVSSVGPKYNS